MMFGLSFYLVMLYLQNCFTLETLIVLEEKIGEDPNCTGEVAAS